ncbi:MAG: hypothetical protein ACPGU1_15670 [Myxococcota bacterium]
MSNWDEHVHPHGALERLAPGLWQVTGSLARGPLPRNMQVWRAPSGELLIQSAICLEAEGMARLDALGKVRWIVVPCPMHRADALPYRLRYPEAELLCPSAAKAKVEEVVQVDGVCEAALPGLGIEVYVPQGLKPFELHLVCPLEDGTKALLVTDALFNLGAEPPRGFGGMMLKWMGSVGPLGMTRLGRWLLLKDRALWRAHLEQLAEISDLSVLCVAHGEAVRGDVAKALRDVIA